MIWISEALSNGTLQSLRLRIDFLLKKKFIPGFGNPGQGLMLHLVQFNWGALQLLFVRLEPSHTSLFQREIHMCQWLSI